MTIEQWVQLGFPVALIVAMFLFFTTVVWPYLTKRRDRLDNLNEQRRVEIDRQYATRHDHYIGSIDDVRDAIRAQTQTQLTVGNEHAVLLAGITKHLEEADERVIQAIEKSKEDIIKHIDRVVGPDSGFDPRKSDPALKRGR